MKEKAREKVLFFFVVVVVIRNIKFHINNFDKNHNKNVIIFKICHKDIINKTKKRRNNNLI